MKKILLTAIIMATTGLFAQVKIGDNPTTIGTSSLLELESTTKGFLPRRMTNDQMKAIASPVNGLTVYNTTLNCLVYYVNGSFNCSHNAPTLSAPAAPLGASYTTHYNGIISGVHVGGTELLAKQTTGETFEQNATCAAKEISAKGCAGLTQVTGASGTVYPLVNINGQCWMQTNLKEIPSNFAAYTPTSWLATSPGDQGHWGYYNSDTTGASGWGISEPEANEGLLYQWSAAMDNSETERSRGLCPAGFHIPSDCEWMYLEHGQGMSISEQNINKAWRANTDDNQGTPGYKLLSQGVGHTNASGFSGLLAGRRLTNGTFDGRSSSGVWWSSSATDASTPSTASIRHLGTGYRGVFRDISRQANGFSVCCLKD